MTLNESLEIVEKSKHLIGTMRRGVPITHIFPAPNDKTFDDFVAIYLKYNNNLGLAIKQTGATDFDICILSMDLKRSIVFHDWIE